MEFDISKPYCHYFNEICKIPHGSKNEQALSEWIAEFARANGYQYVQDELWNIVVYKPASIGYEEKPGVILQAHMDMVCEKEDGCEHDFENEPLKLYVEGDHLRAKGTTLGADDGMGCAYMLAVLADKTLKHPYLECCFTTQEELGLIGAQALKPEYFQARQLINLDGAGEYKTYMSMAGGERITLRLPAVWEENKEKTYCLTVDGLLGGAVSSMIDKERAHAGKAAARILCTMQRKGIAFRLLRLEGGRKRHLIMAEAKAVFAANAPEELLQSVVQECEKELFEEYEWSDSGIRTKLCRTEKAERVLSEQTGEKLLKLIYLLPQGVMARNLQVQDCPPITSVNTGVISLKEDAFELELTVKSALASAVRELETRLSVLAELFGASVEWEGYYPGWKYEAKSKLRETMKQVFLELYGKPLNCLIGHGGNECGIFKEMFPEMDIVTSGAIYGNIHTTDEFLDLASFDRAWVLLTRLLEAL